jgi:hypothetical protein
VSSVAAKTSRQLEDVACSRTVSARRPIATPAAVEIAKAANKMTNAVSGRTPSRAFVKSASTRLAIEKSPPRRSASEKLHRRVAHPGMNGHEGRGPGNRTQPTLPLLTPVTGLPVRTDERGPWMCVDTVAPGGMIVSLRDR